MTENNKKEDNQYFNGVIGQTDAKKVLSFHLDIQNTTGLISNFLIVGAFGVGKNRITASFASHIVKYPSKLARPIAMVNCASIESLQSFWDEVIMPFAINGSYTIHLDEAHKIPENVQVMLLGLLNPNPEYKNTYMYQGVEYTIDLKKSSFIFTTSNPDELLLPLINRLVRVDLSSYDIQQLSQIISNGLKEIQFEKDLLPKIASVSRKNARQAIKLSEDIRKYSLSKNIKQFNTGHWKDFCNQLSIYPLGLNTIEVKIMKTLKERKSMSLTCLSAVLGSNTTSVRSFYEPFLLSEGLLNIVTPKGRELSAAGQNYVNNLDKDL